MINILKLNWGGPCKQCSPLKVSTLNFFVDNLCTKCSHILIWIQAYFKYKHRGSHEH